MPTRFRFHLSTIFLLLAAHAALAALPTMASDDVDGSNKLFDQQIAPILERNCVACHNQDKREGGLVLDSAAGLAAGGDSGPVVDLANAHESSILLAVLPGGNEPPSMPKGRPALSTAEVAALRSWLAAKAPWPENRRLSANEKPDEKWWSLEPLHASSSPSTGPLTAEWARENYIDAYIHERLVANELQPARPAQRRELVRRVTYDLTGLPPTNSEVLQFVDDQRPDAYERLVDRLLASPAQGERWARHWLDVVHYGETHGYDKDKLRLNAWPYRDYVIRALNNDKPYDRFICEQIAGDVLWPNNYEAVEAVGFLSAGPWDFIGHFEVPESKLDGRIARHLDRDDMVQNTFLTFQSLTIGCAQCHNHKFDPITQQEYYGLQAVFAALDRTDRPYYRDEELMARFSTLQSQQRALTSEKNLLRDEIDRLGDQRLAELDKRLAQAKLKTPNLPAEHGYHSAIESQPDRAKWVQVDLGEAVEITALEWIACHDDFAGIGAGFGAPKRWKIEAADQPQFETGVQLLWDHSQSAFANPGIQPQVHEVSPAKARYVRFTALELAERKDDYILALAELRVLSASGENLALRKTVTSLDSIEAPDRWSMSNLVDDKYPRAAVEASEEAQLVQQREQLLQSLMPAETLTRQRQVDDKLHELEEQLKSLPSPEQVYVATIHYGSGAFSGTGPSGGQPRKVQVLPRGDVARTGPEAQPVTLACFEGLTHELGNVNSTDAERRQALAAWMTSQHNPLTWRSIANRLWSYHFQRGIVDTPNDFGRMGGLPSHPQLLDRMAIELRDQQSLKQLHRAMVLSATYRQSSNSDARTSEMDPRNQWLAHSPRKRLEAEAIRDAMLQVAGLLRREMGGPSYQDFVIEHPEHSPHYEYRLHDPRSPSTMRRSVYRFIARSQTQPLMTSLDCADPSMQVDVRNQSNSATQALTLLNNAFTLMAAEEWADRVSQQGLDESDAVGQMFASATGRQPDAEEQQMLCEVAQQQGLTTVARVIFNLNEFVYID